MFSFLSLLFDGSGAGWGPHAYFQMLAESQNGNPPNNINGSNAYASQSELQGVYVDSQHGHSSGREVDSHDSGPILDGRRY